MLNVLNVHTRTRFTQRPLRLLLLLAVLLGLAAVPTTGRAASAAPAAKEVAAADFHVVGFYSGTWDAAHINFVAEARKWFPQTAAANNFTFESTNNWNRLTGSGLQGVDVVLFLDDLPQSAAQRSGFEQYMRNGGGWMGFHVAAFTTGAQQWPWYHNEFLGSGNFRSNTWGPTTAKLKTENTSHPALAGIPATFTSSVSEWYSWSNNLRSNPDIKVLASVDQSSFPLGTDPNQSWYSGDYPILWTNSKYKMLYANFGHNAMDYNTNTGLSSTFDSATQNRFVVNGLKWLAQ